MGVPLDAPKILASSPIQIRLSYYLNGYSRKAETLAEVDSIINIITKIVKTSSQKKDSTNSKPNTQNPKPKIQNFS